MADFSNRYLSTALRVMQSRREVITFTEQEEQLYQVLASRDERSVFNFLRENPSFNFLIMSLQI